jgi:hypothetical protein
LPCGGYIEETSGTGVIAQVVEMDGNEMYFGSKMKEIRCQARHGVGQEKGGCFRVTSIHES